MEVSQTHSSGELIRERLRYGSQTLTYEDSEDGDVSVHWRADMEPQDFFEKITEDFNQDDYGMAILTDDYDRTPGKYQGPIDTTVEGLRHLKEFYNRAQFIVVGDEDYEATWEDTGERKGPDSEICFLLKADESVENSLMEDLMDETLEEAESFYEDVREMYTTDFEDLRARAE